MFQIENNVYCESLMAAQRKKILQFEKKLGIGPVEAARQLQTPYDTYKRWKNESNVMPGATWVAIDLLLEKQKK